MATYSLFLFEGGRGRPGVTLESDDDDEAERRAKEHCEGKRGELWRGQVLVASWPATSFSKI